MKKSGLKLPKRFSKEPSIQKEPTTAEEFVEEGAILEESGDRWLGSDLSKGLRFFQKAFVMYTKGIELSQPGYIDSYYNASRLLFHVYTNYTKEDGVNFKLLSNVNDAIDSSSRAVVQPLEKIIMAHESAIDFAEKSSVEVPLDLLFNTVLVYTQDIEENSKESYSLSRIIEIGHRNLDMIQKVIERQLQILQRFIKDLENIDNQSATTNQQIEKEDEQQFIQEQALQPSDLYETVTVAYKLIQVICEAISAPQDSVAVVQLITKYAQDFETVATELENSFSYNTNNNEFLKSISKSQIEELSIIRTNIKGAFENDLDSLLKVWGTGLNFETPEVYMSMADNLQLFLDRNDISISSGDGEILWKTLTKMTNLYKQALELLNIRLQEKRKEIAGNVEGLGSLISQICVLYIGRGDIDVQRCQIQIETAQKSQNLLLQNCKNFYKSAINVSNTSGGLRERAIEKLTRQKRKVEAYTRLCIIEGKTSEQELDALIGREWWVEEMIYLKDMDIFQSFAINDIEVPIF